MAKLRFVHAGLSVALTSFLCLVPGTVRGQSFDLINLTPDLAACANNTAFVRIRIIGFGGFDGHVFLDAPQGPGTYIHNGFVPQPISPQGFFPNESSVGVYFFPSAAGPITIPITGTPNFGSGAFPKTVLARFFLTPSIQGVVINALSPKANQTDIGLHPRFSWSPVTSSEFTATLDDDMVMPKLESITTTANTVRFNTTLQPNSSYQFEVQATNSCSTSTVASITATTAQACFFVDSPIPDNGVLESRVLIAGNIAESLRVTLGIDHPRAGDIKATLHRLGTSAVLIDRPGFPSTSTGCNKPNIESVFNDSAAMLNESQCEAFGPALAGQLRPSEPLSAFEGIAASGEWMLRVEDMNPQQSGRLIEWCLSSGNSPGDTPFAPDLLRRNGFENVQ